VFVENRSDKTTFVWLAINLVRGFSVGAARVGIFIELSAPNGAIKIFAILKFFLEDCCRTNSFSVPLSTYSFALLFSIKKPKLG
jgi:hypothetical protein